MKKKVKAKPLSRLDKQGLEIVAQAKTLVDTGHRITRLECRVDKVDSTLARELLAIREAFQLTDEWRNRALKAEHALSLGAAPIGDKKDTHYWEQEARQARESMKRANDTLDQFKREDEARAEAIREIVRPLGFDLFAPMDAVRAMAKLTFSLRDELASLRAAEAHEQAEKDAYIKSRLDERAAQEKSNLEKQPAAPEVEAYCVCVRVPREGPVAAYDPETETPVDRRWYGHVVLAQKGCRHCGGTGYRRKDAPGPLPLDATLYERAVAEKERRARDVAQYPDVDPNLFKGEKPLRLLVEIVSKKDEKHGIRYRELGCYAFRVAAAPSRINPSGLGIEPAMSIQELPQMPTMTQLCGHYAEHFFGELANRNGTETATARGIRAVLAACGLEVPE